LSKPVRPEDIRTVIERWAVKAASVDAPRPLEVAVEAVPAGPEQNNSAAESHGVKAEAPQTEPPVDMDRLLDFTDGDPENLRELATLYLEQTSGQLEQLRAAAQTANASEVRRLAHSCAGASATCGMRHLVPLLRELERMGFEAQLDGAIGLCAAALEEFGRIRSFLTSYMETHGELASPRSCP
jgi:HPt (histidine-containing phosphotransfer) domain-containing protein